MIRKHPIQCFCTVCQSTFFRYRNRGFMDVCTPCSDKQRALDWKHAHPDRKRALNEKWIAENAEKNRVVKAEWQKRNPENGRQRQRYRGTRVRRATPKWVSRDEILAVYRDAVDKTKETGIEHHVDHIVPLAGKTVSGLHVPWNLRVITGLENKIKGNRLMEAMPNGCSGE